MCQEPVSLGDAIRTARMNKGYTQEYLSEKLEITTGHLQHIERNFRKPSVPMLFRIMELLDLSIDNLVFGKSMQMLSVEGLSEEQIAALATLIETMKNTNRAE